MNRHKIKKIHYDHQDSVTGITYEKSYLLSEQCLQCRFGITSCSRPLLCGKRCAEGLPVSEKIMLGGLCNDYKHF